MLIYLFIYFKRVLKTARSENGFIQSVSLDSWLRAQWSKGETHLKHFANKGHWSGASLTTVFFLFPSLCDKFKVKRPASANQKHIFMLGLRADAEQGSNPAWTRSLCWACVWFLSFSLQMNDGPHPAREGFHPFQLLSLNEQTVLSSSERQPHPVQSHGYVTMATVSDWVHMGKLRERRGRGRESQTEENTESFSSEEQKPGGWQTCGRRSSALFFLFPWQPVHRGLCSVAPC